MIEICDKRGGLGILDLNAALLFYGLKWYNCNVELTFEFCR